MFSYTSDGAKNCVVTKTFEDHAIKEVSAEYNLPDYLPDINRILRTDVRICRAGKYINGSSLEYDGTLGFCVVYCTTDGVMKSAVFESDYSGSVAIPDISGDCGVEADTTMDSVSCRLQNPRKLTVRAKVRVTVQITCAECTAPALSGKLSAGEENGIQYKNETLDCCFRVGATDADAAVSEDVEASPPLPQIGELVAVTLDPYLYEVRGGDAVISYKGTVFAGILYSAAQDDENAPPKYISFSRKIPISGEAAAEGVTPNCICTGTCCVTRIEYRVNPNASGEMRTVEIDFSYSAYLDAYCNAKSEVTTDMYSTDYESNAEYKKIDYRTALGARTFNFTQNACTELSDSDFGELVSVSASSTVTGAEKSGGKLVFTGMTDVSAILSNGGNVYSGKSFQAPFRAEIDAGFVPDDFDYTASAAVIDAKGRIDAGKLCADIEIAISYAVFANKTAEVVSRLTVMRDKPRTRPALASITLYYPSKHDTLWDIAKKYGTSKAELAAANGLSGEPSEGDVMIIPRRDTKKAIYTKII